MNLPDEAARIHRKKGGGFRGQGFSEGYVQHHETVFMSCLLFLKFLVI